MTKMDKSDRAFMLIIGYMSVLSFFAMFVLLAISALYLSLRLFLLSIVIFCFYTASGQIYLKMKKMKKGDLK